MNKIAKKITSIILTAVLTSTMVCSVWADPYIDVDASNGDEQYSKTNNTVTSCPDYPVVKVNADNGHTATVTLAGIENESDTGGGIEVATQNYGEAVVTINGNVENRGYNGITQMASSKSEATVNVTGSVYSGLKGVWILGDNSDAEITVGRSVSASDIGVEALTSNPALTKVTVGEDVEGGNVGVWLNSYKGTINVSVAGDVSATDGFGAGIKSTITEQGEANVLVEGTITAQHGIEIDSYSTALPTVTAWKIVPNRDGNVATDGSGAVNTEMEAAIQYIIRVKQPQTGATISVTDENGDALVRVEGLNDNVWNVANEGNKVLVKIDVQNGYKVDRVYGDKNKTLPLVKDANGDYYVLVPKGGGVSISAVISHDSTPPAPAPQPQPQPSPQEESKTRENTFGNTNIEPIPAPAMSDSQMIMMINSVAPGSTVTLGTLNGTGLSPAVVQAMLMRRDITIVVVYKAEDGTFKVVIPAGAELTPLINASGGIDFVNLGIAFGATPA